MKATYNDLIEHIAELESAKGAAHSGKSLYEKKLKDAKERIDRLTVQQTCMKHLISLPQDGPSDHCQETAELLVKRLGWKQACLLRHRGERFKVLGSSGFSTSQLEHIHDYAGSSHALQSAVHEQKEIVTPHHTGPGVLDVRVLFQSDEVLGVPVTWDGVHLAYLVVGWHGGAMPVSWDIHQELVFLQTLGNQLAYIMHNSLQYKNLEEKITQLEHVDEMKDSFITITSHQLRTPLSITKWVLFTLHEDPLLDTLPQQKHLIEQAYESNERLVHVVNDMLNVSRIQDGELPYSPKQSDINMMVEELLPGFTSQCRNHGIELKLRVPKDLPPMLADTYILRQALQSLMDNAVDYNLEKDGWIRLDVTVKGGCMHISITNPGLRVTKEDRNKIFDQFYRSEDAVRAKPDGNGLGLFLARAIAKTHGGDVVCETADDASTTFTMELPIKEQ